MGGIFVEAISAACHRPVSAPSFSAPAVSGPGEPVRQTGEPARPQRRPVMDEYVPEEKQEPSGRYWPGRDEEGRPRLFVDGPSSPDRPEDSPRPPEDGAPEREVPEDGDPERKTERCTCDTGRVDREIERLKRKREELSRQLNAETDGGKIRELERKLAQVEDELRQKDNDAYRRQHAEFS